MEEKRYIISDAAKLVGVEPHVLRYWEEELEINILRNELGHRYYLKEDVDRLCAIKRLKDKGFQLKAIKVLLPELNKLDNLDEIRLLDLRDKLEDVIGCEPETVSEADKQPDNLVQIYHHRTAAADEQEQSAERLLRFRSIMGEIISEELLNNNDIISRKIGNNVKEAVIKELNFLFRANEEREEEHFKQLDRTLREYRESRQSAAASREKRFGFLHRKLH